MNSLPTEEAIVNYLNAQEAMLRAISRDFEKLGKDAEDANRRIREALRKLAPSMFTRYVIYL